MSGPAAADREGLGSLDELFERVGPSTGAVADRPVRWGVRLWPVLRWVLASAAGSVVLGAAVLLVLHVLGVELWYPAVPAVIFTLLVLRRALRLVEPQPGGYPEHADQDPADPDGLVPAVYRWAVRIRWERAGLWRSSRGLQPQLVELVDERLRQRHGFTFTSAPQRARALLGERLWRYLASPDARTPPPRELAAMLTTLEKI